MQDNPMPERPMLLPDSWIIPRQSANRSEPVLSFTISACHRLRLRITHQYGQRHRADARASPIPSGCDLRLMRQGRGNSQALAMISCRGIWSTCCAKWADETPPAALSSPRRSCLPVPIPSPWRTYISLLPCRARRSGRKHP